MSGSAVVLEEKEFDWLNPDYAPVYAARAARLETIRADPSILPALKEYYKTHPADFIHDWGMTADPRNAEIDRDVNMPFLLFEKQREFIDWLYERWRTRDDGLVEKSRDMGVSWLCVAFGVWMWAFRPNTIIGYGSLKEEYVDSNGDPKALLWKARSFINTLPVEFRPRGYVEKAHAPYMKIKNPENGAIMVGESGDNIGRGNRTSIYFKDESAQYIHAESIDMALSATSNVKIDVSTPKGAGNAFYRKRMGGKIPVFTFHWRQNPLKNQAWYDEQARKNDAVIMAQEFDINYEASVTDSFIPAEPVNKAMSRGPADVEAHGPIIWGLDVARFGNDKTVLIKRQGRVVTGVDVWTKKDTQYIAQTVWFMASQGEKKPMQIAVDDIGVGGGVTDRLKELSRGSEISIEAVNSSTRVSDGRNYNLRTKMWDDMKAWIEDEPASLPNDPELKAELTALRYKFQSGTRLLESKDDAKKRGIKSPDMADALALTFARPVISAYKPVKFASEFRQHG